MEHGYQSTPCFHVEFDKTTMCLKRKVRMLRKLLLSIMGGKNAVNDVRTAIESLDNERFGRWVKTRALDALDVADQFIRVTNNAVNLARDVREDAINHVRANTLNHNRRENRYERNN